MAENMEKQGNMETQENKDLKHTGHMAQTGIYLGKLFRMFVFQSDWKVMPMAAIIAGLVCFVVGGNLFKTMEGTLLGTFALSCVCIWNGFFNSIQVVCRERPIIKREHRSGMHISSYILAHMIYQAFLCAGQAAITLLICTMMKVTFPAHSNITPWPIVDIGITLFLTTYAADMMALMVSSIVHNTTTAMTIMPFLLIFQLVFSGGFFSLEGFALKLTNVTVAKWGLTALCAQGDYNNLPMVALWNSAFKLSGLEVDTDNSDIQGMVENELLGIDPEDTTIMELKEILKEEGIDLGKELSDAATKRINDIMAARGYKFKITTKKPVWEAMHFIEENGLKEELLHKSAEYNRNPNYDGSLENILNCWLKLVLFIVLFACMSVASLEYIDRDKR